MKKKKRQKAGNAIAKYSLTMFLLIHFLKNYLTHVPLNLQNC